MTDEFDAHARIVELQAEIESWRDNVRLLLEAHEHALHELNLARARITELELLSDVACSRIRQLERELVVAGDVGE